TFFGDAFAEHLVVEHCFVDRNRQCLLCTEANRVRELLGIFDARDLEGADTDPVVGDAETDSTLRQPMRGKELLERLGECVGITQLPADDNAGLERSTRNLLQLRRPVVRHPRRGKLRGADLETDDTLRALRAALALDLRLPDLRSL